MKMGIKSSTVNTALVALAAFALVSFVQRKVVMLPVVGQYLPR